MPRRETRTSAIESADGLLLSRRQVGVGLIASGFAAGLARRAMGGSTDAPRTDSDSVTADTTFVTADRV
jgi:hypothetical protein